MSEKTEKKESILPKFEEIEKTWIIAVLAQPQMKPKRAANMFVHRFDRFLELPDPDKDSNSEDKYFSIDKVIKAVKKKFYYFRRNKGAALYKPIQAKKALYNKAFGDFIEIKFIITDQFELLNYLEEVYLGIEEYSAGKLKILKEGVNIRGLLCKPKQPGTEWSETPAASGWHIEKAPTRAEQARINAEKANAEKVNAETKTEN